MDKVLLESNSSDWESPKGLYKCLNEEFHFSLDPCATRENALCEKYFTKEINGLAQDWSRDVVFMNSPYGKETGKWVKKAYEESQKGATVVCLLAARTDTKWWHEYVMKASEVRLLKGRLKFSNVKNSAPFPSTIVVFTRGTQTTEFSSWAFTKNDLVRISSFDDELTTIIKLVKDREEDGGLISLVKGDFSEFTRTSMTLIAKAKSLGDEVLILDTGETDEQDLLTIEDLTGISNIVQIDMDKILSILTPDFYIVAERDDYSDQIEQEGGVIIIPEILEELDV